MDNTWVELPDQVAYSEPPPGEPTYQATSGEYGFERADQDAPAPFARTRTYDLVLVKHAL